MHGLMNVKMLLSYREMLKKMGKIGMRTHRNDKDVWSYCR